jgi:hypothetical protein
MLKILQLSLGNAGQKHHRNYELRAVLMQLLQRLELAVM